MKDKKKKKLGHYIKILLAGVLILALGSAIAFRGGSDKAQAKTLQKDVNGISWSYTIDTTVQDANALDVNIYAQDIATDVVVPNYFEDDYGKHYVTTIGRSTISNADSFFDGCDLTTIVNVDASGCEKLETVNAYAFYRRGFIKDVKLPKYLRRVGDRAFYSCQSAVLSVPNPNTYFEGVYGTGDISSAYRIKGPERSAARDYMEASGAAAYSSTGETTYKLTLEPEIPTAMEDLPLQSYAYVAADLTMADLYILPELVHHDFGGYYSERNGKGTCYYNAQGTLLENITADMTVYASYIPKTYAVTYEPNEGTMEGDCPTKYTYGTGIHPLPVPVKTGYTFDGWCENKDLMTDPVFSLSATDYGAKKLYAKWQANVYSIRYQKNGGTGMMSDQKISCHTSVPLTSVNFRRTGYTFAGWNTKEDGSGISYQDGQEIENLSLQNGEVIDLYAVWKPNEDTEYHVECIYAGLPGQAAEELGGTFYGTTGAEVTLDPKQWEKTGFTAPEPRTVTIAADGTTVVTYYYTRNTYTIRYHVNGGTSPMPDHLVYYGQSVALHSATVQRGGYTYINWNTKADGKGTSYADEQEVENLSLKNGAVIDLYAVWKAKTYQIVYETGNGMIQGDYPTSYATGSEVVLPTQIDRPGFIFDGWYEDEFYQGERVAVIPAGTYGEKKYYAAWTTGAYRITLNTAGGTIRSGNVTSYQYYEGAVLPTDVIKKGYSFLGWWDGTRIVTEITSKDYGNKAFTALWQDNSKMTSAVIDFEYGDFNSSQAVSIVSRPSGKNAGYYYTQLSGVEKQIYETLYHKYQFIPKTGKINLEPVIIKSAKGFTYANVQNAQVAMLADHPEIFWVRNFAVSSVTTISDGAAYCYLSQITAYDKTSCLADAIQYHGYFTMAIRGLGIRSTDSAYLKIKKIYNYIIRNYSYDSYGYTLNQNTSNDTRSVGRMLSSKTGCCEGYARLMKVFCDYYGIECIVVGSTNHMWNQIKLNGKWYACDVTAGDGLENPEKNYLLKGKKKFSGGVYNILKSWLVDSSGNYITKYAAFAVPAISSSDYQLSTRQSKIPGKGKVYPVGALKYKVTKSARKNGTVSVSGVKTKKLKKAVIPETVKIKGVTFKVTAIRDKAFAGCKKLAKITIGKNVTKIGAKVFYKDKKLKLVTVKSTKIKKVGKNALRGIYKKAVVKVKKKNYKKYKKLLSSKTGFVKKTMKIKK